MSEFTIQSESIDVEQIMQQIRRRIREKRDEDYTEAQIRELAGVKLERFLDPQNIRSDMLAYYRKRLREKQEALSEVPQAPPSFEFDPDCIYRSSRGLSGRILYRVRKLLSPILKFFFNPAPIVHALTVQQQINERQAEVISQMVKSQAEFIEIAALNYEVMHNLVVEMTRLSIDMKNHRMRVESVAGRLDFDERRARALEGVVQYREDSSVSPRTAGDTAAPSDDVSNNPERRRRRRRRGRRRPAGESAASDAPASGPDTPATASTSPAEPAAAPASPPAEPPPSDASPTTGETRATGAAEAESPPTAPSDAGNRASDGSQPPER